MRREGDYYENEFCKKSNSTCNVRFVCCFDGRMRKFCIYRKESRSNIRRVKSSSPNSRFSSVPMCSAVSARRIWYHSSRFIRWT